MCQIDRTGNTAASPVRNLQKAATNLLGSTLLQKHDFSQPITERASRVLGPIGRHHVAQIIPTVRNAARASRPAWACAQRDDFTLKMKNTHAEWDVFVSQIDYFFHILTSAFSFPTFSACFGGTPRFPRENLFLQCGIVVMGLIDAFVYAHNNHRQNADNPGKFQDCMEGRIRLMTAITLAYVHAFQAICFARRPLDINPCH